MSAPNTTVLGAVGAIGLFVFYKKVFVPIIDAGAKDLGRSIGRRVECAKSNNASAAAFIDRNTTSASK